MVIVTSNSKGSERGENLAFPWGWLFFSLAKWYCCESNKRHTGWTAWKISLGEPIYFPTWREHIFFYMRRIIIIFLSSIYSWYILLLDSTQYIYVIKLHLYLVHLYKQKKKQYNNKNNAIIKNKTSF